MSITYQNMWVRVDGPEGEIDVLKDITLDLTQPVTAIIGENGSGKSTLAKTLAGLQKYTAGSVQINGLEVATHPKTLRKQVGMIVANAAAQIIMPTVAEDVALTLRGSGLSKAEQQARVEQALAEHELTELADRSCYSLSSGQMQRLALCAVTIARPSVLIADEPTSALDARHQRIVTNRLFAQPETTQVVLVTHDLQLASRCDEAVWINQGQVAGQGEPAKIIADYLDYLDQTDTPNP